MRAAFLFIIASAWMFWLGGLTFYISVVVPVGGEILGPTVQGEVTAIVTNYLNLSSAIASLLVLAWGWRRNRRTLLVGCLVILICTLVLVGLREALLDLQQPRLQRRVWNEWMFSEWTFYQVHRIYLWVTTLQWFAGLIVTWRVLVTLQANPETTQPRDRYESEAV